MILNTNFTKIRSVLFSVLFIVLMATTSFAATYYVDNRAGSDSNPGTSNQPWKYSPGMAGWSGNASLSAGDIVYFNSGAVWTGSGGSSLLEAKGGVTYDGSTWGSGTRATFQANGSFSRSVINIMSDHSSIETVVRGFHVNANRQSTSGMTVNWPNSIMLTGATKRIENCVVHNIDPAASARYGIKVGATNNRETHNVEILNTTVYDTPRTALSVYAAVTSSANIIKNVTVRGCEVYNGGLDAAAGGNALSMKNNVQNAVFEYNYVHDANGRGISISNTSGIQGPTGGIVRHNIVYNNNKGGIIFAQSGNKSADIYGNLIFKNKDNGSGGSGIYFESDLSGTITSNIYNNTIVENANGEILFGSSSASFSKVSIKNNLFYSLSGKTPLVSSKAGSFTSCFNNAYYRPGGGTLIKDGGSSYSAGNIESNVDPTAIILTASPLENVSNLPTGFIGTNRNELKPNTDGLSIKAGSVLNGGGTILGNAFNSSINNVVREAWDIGAYELGSTKAAPMPPQNLKIL